MEPSRQPEASSHLKWLHPYLWRKKKSLNEIERRSFIKFTLTQFHGQRNADQNCLAPGYKPISFCVKLGMLVWDLMEFDWSQPQVAIKRNCSLALLL